MQETLVLSLGQEDPLKKEMETYSCILAWKVPYTEEPGRLQFMGSQRVRHNWVTEYACINRNSKTCLKWLLWGAEIQRGEMGWVLLIFIIHVVILGFPGGSDSKEYAYNCGRPGFHPWFQKIPWRRAWQPTPVFLPGEFHGQRRLVGYSLWDCKESDTTEWIKLSHYVLILFWPLKHERDFCWYK